jgi:hypothetical protein
MAEIKWVTSYYEFSFNTLRFQCQPFEYGFITVLVLPFQISKNLCSLVHQFAKASAIANVSFEVC